MDAGDAPTDAAGGTGDGARSLVCAHRRTRGHDACTGRARAGAERARRRRERHGTQGARFRRAASGGCGGYESSHAQLRTPAVDLDAQARRCTAARCDKPLSRTGCREDHHDERLNSRAACPNALSKPHLAIGLALARSCHEQRELSYDEQAEFPMKFEKWQALGNDYMIVEQSALPFELTPERIRKLCAGHFGVFADGILLLARAQDPRFVANLRIYNPDGSEAELSGNGAREAILYLRRRGWTDQDVFSIQTVAGEIRPTITGPDTCRVDMGRASLTSKDFPGGPADGASELLADARAWSFQHVSIGNPQCAIHVEDLATLNALYF